MRKSRSLLCLFLCIVFLLTGCGLVSGDFPYVRDTTGAISYKDILSTDAPNSEETRTTNDTVIPSTDEPIGTIPAGSFFEIHFIDVGQADAALVLCDGEALLIDGGNKEDSSLIYAYLKEHGIEHLTAIVCTHGHGDHVGGLAGALNYATVGTAYCSVTEYDSAAFRNFVKYLDQQGKTITVPEPGDTFTIGAASATVIGPLSPSDEPNNQSIVLMIQYGSTRFLFTGDAELEEENEILDAGYDIKCDLLKVGHHGSQSSTGYRWLREAAPAYAVISVGTDNSYGHPTEDVLSRLRDAEVTVYRTDLQGHIICSSDGSTLSFRTERNSDADTLAGAGEGSVHTAATEAYETDNNPSDNGPSAEDPEVSESSSAVKFVCNTNTMKFHYPDCSSVDQMAEHNKWETDTPRDDLIAQGYSPCGRCDP